MERIYGTADRLDYGDITEQWVDLAYCEIRDPFWAEAPAIGQFRFSVNGIVEVELCKPKVWGFGHRAN